MDLSKILSFELSNFCNLSENRWYFRKYVTYFWGPKKSNIFIKSAGSGK